MMEYNYRVFSGPRQGGHRDHSPCKRGRSAGKPFRRIGFVRELAGPRQASLLACVAHEPIGVSPAARKTPYAFPVRVEGKRPSPLIMTLPLYFPLQGRLRTPSPRKGKVSAKPTDEVPHAGCTPGSMGGDGSPCKGSGAGRAEEGNLIHRQRAVPLPRARGRQMEPAVYRLAEEPPSPCAWKAKSPSPAAREPFGIVPAARKTPYAFPSQGEGVGEADG